MLKEEKMTKSELAGVPAEGLRTVGQIRGTNDLIFHTGQNAMAIALELVSTHTPGAPVIDDHNEFIGFISEIDVGATSGDRASRIETFSCRRRPWRRLRRSRKTCVSTQPFSLA